MILDTYAWVEYLIGSKKGNKVQELMQSKNKMVTLDCCLAEIRGYCLKSGLNFNRALDIVNSNSLILPVLQEHWLKAAALKFEIRKKVENFGLIDAILVAKQQELDSKIVTGDHHFKNLKNVVFFD